MIPGGVPGQGVPGGAVLPGGAIPGQVPTVGQALGQVPQVPVTRPPIRR